MPNYMYKAVPAGLHDIPVGNGVNAGPANAPDAIQVFKPHVTSVQRIAAESGPNGVYSTHLMGLGAASSKGFPAVAVKTTAVYAQPKTDSQTIATLGVNTRVNVISISGSWWQIYSSGGLGWVPASAMKDAPEALPSDGVQALQQALTDLAALGYPTDPKGTSGNVDFNTLSALANAISVVGSEIKGGETAKLVAMAALNSALISKTVTNAATTFVKANAKPLAIAVQIFVAKRRGAAGIESGFLPTYGTWSPMTIGLAVLGGVVLAGGLYLVLKK